MSKRVFGLDLVRAIAVLFVISVHFFLNIGFYDKDTYGTVLFGQSILRWLFFTCVPLFLILTGYLKVNKKLDKNHYKSILHILAVYLFASICVIIFRKIYLQDPTEIFDLFLGIFSFSTDSYAWYIEMYIGLFILIPFLNIIYKAMDTKVKKQFLIISLLALTSISVISRGVVVGGHDLSILPDWWQNIFPITYYFIGAYIREYQITLPKLKNIFYIFLILGIQVVIFNHLTYGRPFDQQIWASYGNIYTAVLAILIFILFYKADIKNKTVNFIIKDISFLSLDIYLLSYIFDRVFYPILTPYMSNYMNTIPLFFIAVPLVFLSSYLLANVRRLIFYLCSIIHKKILKIT